MNHCRVGCTFISGACLSRRYGGLILIIYSLISGGKKCLSCDNRIYHDQWSITPELAEARWAHKEAKARELDEVIDFLN